MHSAAPPENDGPDPARQDTRPELGSAQKRDRLLQRVRAARKRLTPARGSLKLH